MLGTTLCPKQARRISIFFFGIPFLLVRGMLFYVSIQVAEPELSVLVMKNRLCLLMNFLQFKVLNQASEEAEGDIHKLIGGRNARVAFHQNVVAQDLDASRYSAFFRFRNMRDRQNTIGFQLRSIGERGCGGCTTSFR